VLWNQAIQIDKEVTAYKSDIIIKNKEEKTSKLTDAANLLTEILCKGKRKS
jgi:hypothetical protein